MMLNLILLFLAVAVMALIANMAAASSGTDVTKRFLEVTPDYTATSNRSITIAISNPGVASISNGSATTQILDASKPLNPSALFPASTQTTSAIANDGERLARLNQFVAGRDHGNARFARDRNLRDAASGAHADLARTDDRAGGQRPHSRR